MVAREDGRTSGQWRNVPAGLVAAALVLGCTVEDSGTTSKAMTSGPGEDDSPTQVLPPLFTEVTQELGLTFRHRAGAYADYAMPAVMGGGAAVFDYDNDGDLDLYLIDSGELRPAAGVTSGNRLYRMGDQGTYTDATVSSGLGDTGYGMGCAVGDVDNDGDLDVYVTNAGPDVLYRNNGDGTFSDTTAAAGIDGSGWSTSAVFFDYDRDGYLDLYVARYVNFDPQHRCALESGQREFCGPTAFPGVFDLLYHNQGGGRFKDVSFEAGIDGVRDAGLGVLSADFNDDRWPDVYVANDADPNHLWINQGDGTFVDQAVVLGAAYNQHGLSEAGMGIAAGDADGDGDLDLLVTHLIQESNTFYENLGAAGFDDSTATVGVGIASLDYTGFGTAFFDYDNDGDLDLGVVNGAVKKRTVALGPQTAGFWRAYVEPNLLLSNRGDGTFVDVSARAGGLSGELEVSRGFLPADFDGDGDLDVLVTGIEAPARLYRNELMDGRNPNGNGGNWIHIRTLDPALRREALGARIEIVTASRTYVRYALPQGGYLTSGHARIHLGLGAEREVVGFNVRWPDGQEETFAGAPAGQVVELRKGEGSSETLTQFMP